MRLVHASLAERFVRRLLERLIGGNAYESDRLDGETCTQWRRADRSAPEDSETADARRSPAASLPTEVEGRATLLPGSQNSRRIVVLHERVAENMLGMRHVARSLILLRGLRVGLKSVPRRTRLHRAGTLVFVFLPGPKKEQGEMSALLSARNRLIVTFSSASR